MSKDVEKKYKMTTDDIVKKTKAIGKIILGIEEETSADIELNILYTLEDEVYIYANCLKTGLCGYGHSYAEALSALLERLQVHFKSNQNNPENYFFTSYPLEYLNAYFFVEKEIDTYNANLLFKHINDTDESELIAYHSIETSLKLTKKIRLLVQRTRERIPNPSMIA